MLGRLFKDGAIYSVANLCTQGLSFVLLPLYVRVLSPADYGRIDFLTLCSVLAIGVIALQIPQGMARYLPECTTADERQRYASTAIWFTVGAHTALLCAVLSLADYATPRLLDASTSPSLMRMAALSMALGAAFGIMIDVFRWTRQPAKFSCCSVTNGAVGVLATASSLLLLRIGPIGVFYGTAFGASTGIVMSLLLGRGNLACRFDPALCRRMLAFSVPLVPSAIVAFASVYVDRIAIRQLMTLADVGIFGMAYRLVSLVGLLMIGFQNALPPLIMARHADAGTPREIARVFRYFMVVFLIVLLGLSVLAPEFYVIFTVPAYYGAAIVVPPLAAAMALSNMYIFAPGPFVAERTSWITGVTVTTAVVNTGLNFTLIPLLGIFGSAASTCISALVGFLLYMWLSQRWYPVPHRWGPLLGAAGLVVAAIALGQVVSPIGVVSVPLGAALAIKVALTVGVAAAVVGIVLGRQELTAWATRIGISLPRCSSLRPRFLRHRLDIR